jgi:hypothetical protein
MNKLKIEHLSGYDPARVPIDFYKWLRAHGYVYTDEQRAEALFLAEVRRSRRWWYRILHPILRRILEVLT